MKTHRITTHTRYPAYLANGLIGLRVPSTPLGAGAALVNGYWGAMERRDTECYEPAPYPLGLGIALGHTWFSTPDAPGVELIAQEYDFACGELRTQLRLRADAGNATVQILTFACRSWPTAVCQEVAVTPDHDCELTLQSFVEFLGLPGRIVHSEVPRVDCCDFQLLHEARGELARLGIAQHSAFVGDGLRETLRSDWAYDRPMPAKEFRIDAQAGRIYRMQTVATLVPSVMHSEPHHQAGRMCNLALWRGFDGLRRQNRDAWNELWRGRVRIVGADDAIQDISDACFFYTHCNIHRSTPCSIAPFGLSGTPLYNGMVFWDCESYAYPVTLFTQPDAAQAILDYRCRHLDAARWNARLQGADGILFPWESGFSGCEMNKAWGIPTGKVTQNLLIGYAFIQHMHGFGDDDWVREEGWPVLKGIANWLCSRVTRSAAGYELLNLTGIGEDVGNLNNPAVVMMAARLIMAETIALAKRLGKRLPSQWTAVADGLVLPMADDGSRLRRSRDFDAAGARDSLDTLHAFFPLACGLDDAEVERNTIRHFLATAREKLAAGGPMHNSYIGVWAARIGDRKLAAESLDHAIRRYVIDPFMMFGEHATDAKLKAHKKENPPLFQTTPAGFVNACLLGLTGIRVGPDDPSNWGRFPIVMPEGWDGIEVDRIFVRGEEARLRAYHGDERASIE